MIIMLDSSQTDMHPDARISGCPRSWTPEEDVQLTTVVKRRPARRNGAGEYKPDLAAIAALVPVDRKSSVSQQMAKYWPELTRRIEILAEWKRSTANASVREHWFHHCLFRSNENSVS
jgi:hypothetical protein